MKSHNRIITVSKAHITIIDYISKDNQTTDQHSSIPCEKNANVLLPHKFPVSYGVSRGL